MVRFEITVKPPEVVIGLVSGQFFKNVFGQ